MGDAWNPKQYERFEKERSAPFFDLLSMVREGTEGVGIPKAVDLGCGTGALTKILHERCGAQDTVGIDSSEAMLKSASAVMAKGLRFELGDLASFHSPVDLVFSNAALQWCGDHRGIMRRLHDALNPGGQLAIQIPANHMEPTHSIARELGEEEPFRSMPGYIPKVESVLTPEEYADTLHGLGFREQSVRLQIYAHSLASREEVIEWVKGTLLTHYKKTLGPEGFEAFLTEYRWRLLRALPDSKPFFYPFKRILFWARK